MQLLTQNIAQIDLMLSSLVRKEKSIIWLADLEVGIKEVEVARYFPRLFTLICFYLSCCRHNTDMMSTKEERVTQKNRKYL